MYLPCLTCWWKFMSMSPYILWPSRHAVSKMKHCIWRRLNKFAVETLRVISSLIFLSLWFSNRSNWMLKLRNTKYRGSGFDTKRERTQVWSQRPCLPRQVVPFLGSCRHNDAHFTSTDTTLWNARTRLDDRSTPKQGRWKCHAKGLLPLEQQCLSLELND